MSSRRASDCCVILVRRPSTNVDVTGGAKRYSGQMARNAHLAAHTVDEAVELTVTHSELLLKAFEELGIDSRRHRNAISSACVLMDASPSASSHRAGSR